MLTAQIQNIPVDEELTQLIKLAKACKCNSTIEIRMRTSTDSVNVAVTWVSPKSDGPHEDFDIQAADLGHDVQWFTT